MVPLYFLLLRLGLVNKLIGLVIVYTGTAIPFSTLMLRSYIETAYSKNLEDSARVDGCSYFQVYYHITIPLCMPGIAAVALFAFMIIYEEFMWANVLITKNSIKTIQTALYSFFGIYSTGTTGGVASAAGVVVTIPTVILAFFLQRYLVTGLTAGAVKE
jgi:ABC-type glycerol-3-phosphate transport system permease component